MQERSGHPSRGYGVVCVGEGPKEPEHNQSRPNSVATGPSQLGSTAREIVGDIRSLLAMSMISSSTDPDVLHGYLSDASNIPGGFAERLVAPSSHEEVVEIVRECAATGTPLTISGAGTGLAGGRSPRGGIVLDTRRLNRIGAVDVVERRVAVEPGAILRDLQSEVEAASFLYPPDPTERTCFIGGSIATNASGARTFKYGPTRHYVRGLRVVLANGDTLQLQRGQASARNGQLELRTEEGRAIAVPVPTYPLPATRKHAAGYYAAPGMDAVDLFVGSEGTLGVITLAELDLLPLPERLFAGLVFFPHESATLAFVQDARGASFATRGSGEPGIDARALEYLDGNALSLIRGAYPTIPEGAEGGAVWFEQETSDESEEALLAGWYTLLETHGALLDESWFAMGVEDQRRLREVRHAVPSAVYEYISEHGQTKIGTDMAVPPERFPALLAYYREQFAATGLWTVTWGHIGDCHLHANILTRNASELVLARAVYTRLVERALELGGTVSAEHGIGKLKTSWLERMYGKGGIEQMRAVKRALDSAMLLGRGTMFAPEESLEVQSSEAR